MPKLDLRDELALIDLRREMYEVEGELFFLFGQMEIEERPRFRAPMEQRYEELSTRYQELEARWLAS